ncbi:LytR/AlgR family response regulator transcription factor [Pedobacter sp. KBS0701]|uniref:LytR/AlgR family response regulator transcription factor n=1 Tax=unclassified Pedobacter TaxID=2628915 RepID=UPI00110DA63C|nr:LytTR family DNA-binding domain-containing protein [Pedobacter sp. KBS0701]QDW25257.1 response regulator transcription factor [Pedobacter sp. KBS0701]
MINCIIVDDEPLAVKLLENHISKIEDLKLVAKGKNAFEAYKLLQNHEVDLMFLDIQMPDLNGIEFVKSLTKKPMTIFTTAFREYAIDGFELEAVDYLLKPITFERFFKSVYRILRNTERDIPDFVVFKAQGFNRKIKINDILYFESNGNDVKLILTNDILTVSKTSISDMETSLRNKGFVRIHRSFLINPNAVTAANHNEILLGKFTVPVGRSYKKDFDNFFRQFFAKRLI